jgi:hypothetical protein
MGVIDPLLTSTTVGFAVTQSASAGSEIVTVWSPQLVAMRYLGITSEARGVLGK